MLQRDNATVFLGAHLDACCLWRLWFPHLNIPGATFFLFPKVPDYSMILGNDTAVVQRCCTTQQYEFIRSVRPQGMKVVYDLDDAIWDIPEYNPAYQVLKLYRDGFANCIRMVDVVSVSTQRLAKEVRRNVKNLRNVNTGKEIQVIVAENRIDERLFADPWKSERLIVGWAGSSSHIGDLPIVQEAITHLAEEHPEALFEFRGIEAPPELRTLANVSHQSWCPVAEYQARMPRWGWAISLAPVTDHPFNFSKSCIKAIEAAYCRIPCLMSWVEPYDVFCSHDRELRWLLCAGRNSWEPKLRELINDPARRDYYGERMHAVMKQHYSFADRPHEGWEHVFAALRN